METLGSNATPLGIAFIAISGILAWLQYLAKKNMVTIQSQFENEKAERQKVLETIANDRQQSLQNHTLYERLIETINRTSASADARDMAYNTTIKELSSAITSLGTETRNGNNKQLEVLETMKQSLNLQSDAMKAVIQSNGTIAEHVNKLETSHKEGTNGVKIAVQELGTDIQKSFSKIEDGLNKLVMEHRGNREIINTLLNDIKQIKEQLDTKPLDHKDDKANG